MKKKQRSHTESGKEVPVQAPVSLNKVKTVLQRHMAIIVVRRVSSFIHKSYSKHDRHTRGVSHQPALHFPRPSTLYAVPCVYMFASSEKRIGVTNKVVD